jgi:hypothetical protein
MLVILYSCIRIKNEICGNYTRNGEVGIKENDGGGEFNYDML